MRKRKTLIIRLLLGWWALCLAGQCLAVPVYQGLDAGGSAEVTAVAGDHCAGEASVCEDSSLIPAFLLVLAAALPLMLWLGVVAQRHFSFPYGPEAWSLPQGPPVYLLSQRFRE
jgi:hypothetical protein